MQQEKAQLQCLCDRPHDSCLQCLEHRDVSQRECVERVKNCARDDCNFVSASDLTWHLQELIWI